jgi:hypothetical protein
VRRERGWTAPHASGLSPDLEFGSTMHRTADIKPYCIL